MKPSFQLSIDTSTSYASTALSLDGKTISEITWLSNQNHSVEFVPTLKKLLEMADMKVHQINAVFVVAGPGKFSALRVGMSVAKAIAMTNDIPLVSIGSLDLEAHPYLRFGLPVCSIIEAGRSKIYVGRYNFITDELSGDGATYTVETHDSLFDLIHEPTLFCGEGTLELSDLLSKKLGKNAVVIDDLPPTRKPSILAKLGYERLINSDTDDIASLAPIYMRGSQFDVSQNSVSIN